MALLHFPVLPMREGWVKLRRSIFEDPLMRRDHVYLAIHFWLLVHATHCMERDDQGHWKLLAESRRYKVRFQNQTIALAPGQLVCGSKQIAQELGIPEATVRRKLTLMEREGLIERQHDNRCSLVTFMYWTEEQLSDRQDERQLSGNRRTNEQQVITNREGRTDKKKETPPNPPTGGVTDREKEAIILLSLWKNYGLPAVDRDLERLCPPGRASKYEPEMSTVAQLYGSCFQLVQYMNRLRKESDLEPLRTFRSYPPRNFYEMFVCEPVAGRRNWRHYVGKDVAFVFDREDINELENFRKTDHAQKFPLLFHG